jgi:hypothetical protein
MPTINGLPVPSGLVISYNSYVFDPTYTHTTEFRVRPVRDRANRIVSHVEYVIGLRTYLGGSGPTDAAVQAVICLLKEAGAPLYYQGIGLGNLVVNGLETNSRDVIFGPWPEVVSCRPMGATGQNVVGHKMACSLDWRVTFHVAPCCEGVQFGLYPMELTFGVTERVTRNGRNERTYAGELRIANNRAAVGGTQVMFSPDDYWPVIPTQLTPGFKREWLPRTIDESRTRLSFG